MNVFKPDPTEYRVPTWIICPMVNADTSALNAFDIEMLGAFEQRLQLNHPNGYSINWPEDTDNAKFFCHDNDVTGFGFADDCIDILVHEYAQKLEA